MDRYGGLRPKLAAVKQRFMTKQTAGTGMELKQQIFERVLSNRTFTGLKAILDTLTRDRDALCAAVGGATSFEDLLGKLGYRLQLTKQIHVADAFTRMGSAGGIKAVLPYYDIPTQRALPTLINFDSSVTTTAESVGFFTTMLAAFKTQTSAENKAAA